MMACPPGLTTLEPVPTEPADRDARPFVADAQLRWNPVKDGLKPQELVYDILSPSLEEGCRKARLGVWVGL